MGKEIQKQIEILLLNTKDAQERLKDSIKKIREAEARLLGKPKNRKNEK